MINVKAHHAALHIDEWQAPKHNILLKQCSGKIPTIQLMINVGAHAARYRMAGTSA